MKNPVLLYEDKPKYDGAYKVLLVLVPALEIIIALALIKVDIAGTWILLGLAVFLIVLFWLITPRAYRIYADRVAIKLGGPLAVNLPLATIASAGQAPAYAALAYWGVRFATSTFHVIEIKRKKGMSYIISPLKSDDFMRELERARQSFTASH